MNQKEFEIRRAKSGDIDQLVDLHRRGFPEEIFYQVPRRYGRRWWKFLLDSKTAEVFVAEPDGKIAGAAVLVIDLKEFQKNKGRFKAPFCIRLATLFSKPNAALKYLGKVLKGHGILKDPATDIKFHPGPEGEFTLLDTSVVAKEFRRQGLLKRLWQRCEERTLELNRPVILTMVDPGNKAPLEANLKVFKSVCVGKSKDGMLFFKKSLAPKKQNAI